MKVAAVLLIGALAIVGIANGQGIISRAIDRHIARLERIIEILKNREKTLVGTARDAILADILKFSERLAKLRNNPEKDTDVDNFLVRRRRDIGSTPSDIGSSTPSSFDHLFDDVPSTPSSNQQWMVKMIQHHLAELQRRIESTSEPARRNRLQAQIDNYIKELARLTERPTTEMPPAFEDDEEFEDDAVENLTTPLPKTGFVRAIELWQNSLDYLKGQLNKARTSQIRQAIQDRINKIKDIISHLKDRLKGKTSTDASTDEESMEDFEEEEESTNVNMLKRDLKFWSDQLEALFRNYKPTSPDAEKRFNRRLQMIQGKIKSLQQRLQAESSTDEESMEEDFEEEPVNVNVLKHDLKFWFDQLEALYRNYKPTSSYAEKQFNRRLQHIQEKIKSLQKRLQAETVTELPEETDDIEEDDDDDNTNDKSTIQKMLDRWTNRLNKLQEQAKTVAGGALDIIKRRIAIVQDRVDRLKAQLSGDKPSELDESEEFEEDDEQDNKTWMQEAIERWTKWRQEMEVRLAATTGRARELLERAIERANERIKNLRDRLSGKSSEPVEEFEEAEEDGETEKSRLQQLLEQWQKRRDNFQAVVNKSLGKTRDMYEMALAMSIAKIREIQGKLARLTSEESFDDMEDDDDADDNTPVDKNLIQRMIERWSKRLESLQEMALGATGVAVERIKRRIAIVTDRIARLRDQLKGGKAEETEESDDEVADEVTPEEKSRLENILKVWTNWREQWRARFEQATGTAREILEKSLERANRRINQIKERLQGKKTEPEEEADETDDNETDVPAIDEAEKTRLQKAIEMWSRWLATWQARVESATGKARERFERRVAIVKERIANLRAQLSGKTTDELPEEDFEDIDAEEEADEAVTQPPNPQTALQRVIERLQNRVNLLQEQAAIAKDFMRDLIEKRIASLKDAISQLRARLSREPTTVEPKFLLF